MVCSYERGRETEEVSMSKSLYIEQDKKRLTGVRTGAWGANEAVYSECGNAAFSAVKFTEGLEMWWQQSVVAQSKKELIFHTHLSPDLNEHKAAAGLAEGPCAAIAGS